MRVGVTWASAEPATRPERRTVSLNPETGSDAIKLEPGDRDCTILGTNKTSDDQAESNLIRQPSLLRIENQALRRLDPDYIFRAPPLYPLRPDFEHVSERTVLQLNNP